MSTSIFARLRTLNSRDGWVRPFFALYRKALLASLALGVITMVFAAALMFASGYLISLSAEDPEFGVWALFVPLAFVQLFGIGRPFLAYLERLVSHDWVLHMTSELRCRLYRSIERNGIFWTATHRAGEALGLLTQDVGHIQNLYLRSIFPQVIGLVCWLLLSIILGVFSPLLGLMTLLLIGVLVLLVPLVSMMANAARQARVSQADAALYSDTYDNVAGVADWVFSGRHDDYITRVKNAYAEKDTSVTALDAASRRRELVVQLVFLIAGLVILAWAANYFGSFAQAVAATGDITRPLDWPAAFVLGFFPLIEAFAPLSDGAVGFGAHMDSLERLNALGSPQEPNEALDGTTAAPQTNADLAIEDVRFSYPDETREVLHNVTLAIPQGQKIAVLGPSGAGKSTLLSLLRGDLTPTSGTVTLGGTPTVSFGDAIAHHVSVIQQETYLFNQTLFDNLRMGNPNVTRDQATQALVAVGLEPLLQRLSNGLDTLVDERGLRFSGGERHRIALARVLLQDTPIVLLDEPCVSLDPMTERAVLDTCLRVLEGKTVVMITHHLAGVDAFDRVVFIEDGQVAIDGAPAQLAATNERYQQLLAFDQGL